MNETSWYIQKKIVPVFTSSTVRLKDEPKQYNSTTVRKRTNEQQILGERVEHSPLALAYKTLRAIKKP